LPLIAFNPQNEHKRLQPSDNSILMQMGLPTCVRMTFDAMTCETPFPSPSLFFLLKRVLKLKEKRKRFCIYIGFKEIETDKDNEIPPPPFFLFFL
jgi:hypothetical protein